MDTYMNKCHPWVQTRNNPRHFSPSLSPQTSPAAGFIPHTALLHTDFYHCFTLMGPRSFQSQDCCAVPKALEQGAQELKLSRDMGCPSHRHLPLLFFFPGHCCCILAPGTGWALELPHLADVPDTSPQTLPTPWIRRVCFCGLSRAEIRTNPETLTGPHTLNSASLPAATQIWLSQETKGFQPVQTQPLKTGSKSSNLLIY